MKTCPGVNKIWTCIVCTNDPVFVGIKSTKFLGKDFVEWTNIIRLGRQGASGGQSLKARLVTPTGCGSPLSHPVMFSGGTLGAVLLESSTGR